MCNLSKGIEDRALEKGYIVGYIEGFLEGKEEKWQIENIISVAHNLNVSLIAAMNLLNVPENEWEKYLKLL